MIAMKTEINQNKGSIIDLNKENSPLFLAFAQRLKEFY